MSHVPLIWVTQTTLWLLESNMRSLLLAIFLGSIHLNILVFSWAQDFSYQKTWWFSTFIRHTNSHPTKTTKMKSVWTIFSPSTLLLQCCVTPVLWIHVFPLWKGKRFVMKNRKLYVMISQTTQAAIMCNFHTFSFNYVGLLKHEPAP